MAEGRLRGKQRGILHAQRWVRLDQNTKQTARWYWQDGATQAQVEISITGGRFLAGRVTDPTALGDAFEAGQTVWVQRCLVKETHDGVVVAEQQQVRVYSERKGPAISLRAEDAQGAVTLVLTQGGQLRPASDATAKWRSCQAFWQPFWP